MSGLLDELVAGFGGAADAGKKYIDDSIAEERAMRKAEAVEMLRRESNQINRDATFEQNKELQQKRHEDNMTVAGMNNAAKTQAASTAHDRDLEKLQFAVDNREPSKPSRNYLHEAYLKRMGEIDDAVAEGTIAPEKADELRSLSEQRYMSAMGKGNSLGGGSPAPKSTPKPTKDISMGGAGAWMKAHPNGTFEEMKAAAAKEGYSVPDTLKRMFEVTPEKGEAVPVNKTERKADGSFGTGFSMAAERVEAERLAPRSWWNKHFNGVKEKALAGDPIALSQIKKYSLTMSPEMRAEAQKAGLLPNKGLF